MINDVKQYLAKYFTNVVSILTLLGCLAFAYKWYNDVEYEKTQRAELESRYGKLIGTEVAEDEITDTLLQLRTKYKTQDTISKEFNRTYPNLQIFQEERVKNLQQTTLTLGGINYTSTKPNRIFETQGGTKGYSLYELNLNGLNSPPLGYILLDKDGNIKNKSYAFDIELQSVRIKDDFTGKVRVITKAYLIPQEDGVAKKNSEESWKGKRVPLTVKGGLLTIDPIEPLVPTVAHKEFILWTMNLNGGFGIFGEGEEVFTRVILDVNLLGYGLSKRDLDWKFIHLGANYSNEKGLGLHIMPFTYRPLSDILTNTYIGPGYFLDSIGKGYFIGLNIGF